jgi:hypothetical protein
MVDGRGIKVMIARPKEDRPAGGGVTKVERRWKTVLSATTATIAVGNTDDL